MSEQKTYGCLNYVGAANPKILVICDAPAAGVWERGMVMPKPHMALFGGIADRMGLTKDDFCFLTPCRPVPPESQTSEKRLGEWIAKDTETFNEAIEAIIEEHDPKMVIALGKIGNRQLAGKNVPITKVRGSFTTYAPTHDLPVLPAFSPAHVMARPENKDVFESDLRQAKLLRECNWSLEEFQSGHETTGYEWCLDLSDLLRKRPKAIAIDCETVGLDWHKNGYRVLTVSITTAAGNAYVVPLDADYWNDEALRGESNKHLPKLSKRQVARLQLDLKRLLGDADISVVGHNLKFDIHALRTQGIEVAQWYADTIQLAFAVDENMQSKSLTDCTRRWVPAMAGYCLTPDSEVLTANMTHVEVGDLKVGDELLGFEENPTYKTRRKMKTSVVTAVPRKVLPCYKIITNLGRSITVSADHKFLNKNFKGGNWGWRKAKDLQVGHKLMPFPWHKPRLDSNGGYVGGIYDGEGWVSAQGQGMKMGFAQVGGLVLDKTLSILEGDGLGKWISKSKDKRKPCYSCEIGTGPALQALQLYRPIRLISKRPWEGKCLPRSASQPKFDEVMSIEFVGRRKVVAISTSTKTLIAEGLCQHNSDIFDANTDKARMHHVNHDDMLEYAGGDTDATFRLAALLLKLAKQDARNWRTFTHVQMPALRAFVEMEENGVLIDKEELRKLEATLGSMESAGYEELIGMVDPKVLRRHEGQWSFGRADFVRDCLFSGRRQGGLGLEPKVFTKTTSGLSKDEQIPSTSVKDHLGFFDHIEFVQKLIAYQKLSKMRSTYVGLEAQENETEVVRLKGGGLPKRIDDVLKASGVDVPKSRSVRRRVRVIETPQVVKAGPHKKFRVDEYGNVRQKLITDPSGFWQYLQGSDKIHPSFLLHSSVTGRSSCVHADTVLPIRREYLGVMQEEGSAIKDIRQGDEVWTHKNRWQPVIRGFVKPEQEMWRVTLSNGEIVRCTEEHKFWTKLTGWASLRHVCIEKAFKRSEKKSEGSVPLSELLADYVASSEGRRGGAPHSLCNVKGGDSSRGADGVEVSEIFGVKDGEQESEEGKTSTQTERGVWGWARLFDESGKGKEVLHPSHRLCRGVGDTCGGTPIDDGSAPHRRGHNEQSPRQLSGGNKQGASGDPRALCERPADVRITGVEPCGVYPVYDIEVDIDHSYEVAGCFSHNSRGPNAQNFPKRGDLAKMFRKIFVAPEGRVFLEADLSQAELRVAAWMSGDATMIRIYQEGGDIHSATAASVLGVGEDKFNAGREDDTPLEDALAQWPDSTAYLRENPYGKDKQDDGTFVQRATTVADYCDFKRFQAKACLTGDTKVKVKQGYKRLDQLSTADEVWDGISWVRHDGVEARGYKRTVIHQGVEGTLDHIVFTTIGAMPLYMAKLLALDIVSSGKENKRIDFYYGMGLVLPYEEINEDRIKEKARGYGFRALKSGDDLYKTKRGQEESMGSRCPMWVMSKSKHLFRGEHYPKTNNEVQVHESGKIQSRRKSGSARWAIRRYKAKMQKRGQAHTEELRCERDSERVQNKRVLHQLCNRRATTPYLLGGRHRQDRQRGELQGRKPEACYTIRESKEQEGSTGRVSRKLPKGSSSGRRHKGKCRTKVFLRKQQCTEVDIRRFFSEADIIKELGVSEKEVYDVVNAGAQHRYTVKTEARDALCANCNFGFLYGMGWRGFKRYAKLDYGIDFTDQQAQETRSSFFRKYPGLLSWHAGMTGFVKSHEYVRALHGSLRRLPSVNSADDGMQSFAVRQGVNCLSDDTEILTAEGWKTVDEISVGDAVFSADAVSGAIQTDAIQAIHCGQTKGRMLKYDGAVSAIATPNHRWLVDRYSKAKATKGEVDTVFVESEGLSDYGDHKIWLAAEPHKQTGTQWTDDECELMGWVLTDGHYKRQWSPKNGKEWGTGRVGVTQTKKKNIPKLDALFARLGKHSSRVRKTGQHTWEITTEATKRMRDAMPEKTLTMAVLLSISSKQRRILYDAMLAGDGCYDSEAGRYRKFCAGSEERANAFLALCTLMGQPASATCRDFSGVVAKKYASMGNIPKAGKCWLVELKQRNRAQSGYNKSWVEWEGRVWCPTTKNGTWIAKREGRVFVTGNSPVQRLGSDLGLIALHRFVRDAPKHLAAPALFIHDANIIDVPEEHAIEVAAALKYYMESPPLIKWFNIEAPFPILSDVSMGPNLCDMAELKNLKSAIPDWYGSGEISPSKALEEAWVTKRRRQIVLED